MAAFTLAFLAFHSPQGNLIRTGGWMAQLWSPRQGVLPLPDSRQTHQTCPGDEGPFFRRGIFEPRHEPFLALQAGVKRKARNDRIAFLRATTNPASFLIKPHPQTIFREKWAENRMSSSKSPNSNIPNEIDMQINYLQSASLKSVEESTKAAHQRPSLFSNI